MTHIEIWRDIPSVPTLQASSYGRIRNVYTGNIIGHGWHKARPRVTARIRGKQVFLYVHRLVAEAFLPDYRKDARVEHKDGDFDNNAPDNLEMGDRINGRLPKDIRVQVLETGEKYPSISAAARAVDGQMCNVARVLNGTLKHHKGFTFRFVKV